VNWFGVANVGLSSDSRRITAAQRMDEEGQEPTSPDRTAKIIPRYFRGAPRMAGMRLVRRSTLG
jgi:hypothetical protein